MNEKKQETATPGKDSLGKLTAEQLVLEEMRAYIEAQREALKAKAQPQPQQQQQQQQTMDFDKMLDFAMKRQMAKVLPKLLSDDDEPQKKTFIDEYREILLLKQLMGDNSKRDDDLLKMLIAEKQNTANDKIFSILEKQIEGSKSSSDTEKSQMLAELKAMREAMSAKEKEELNQRLDDIAAQVSEVTSAKYQQPPPQPQQDTYAAELAKVINQSLLESNKKLLARAFNIDFDKPKSEQPPTAIDAVERMLKGVGDTVTEFLRGYGEMQAASKGGAGPPTQQFKPLDTGNQAQQPPPPVQSPEPPMEEPPSQPVNLPQPVQSPMEAPVAGQTYEEIPPGENVYQTPDGQLLTNEQVEQLVKQGAKIKVEDVQQQ